MYCNMTLRKETNIGCSLLTPYSFTLVFSSLMYSLMRCISVSFASSSLTVLLLTSNSLSRPRRKTRVFGFKKRRVRSLSRILPVKSCSKIKSSRIIVRFRPDESQRGTRQDSAKMSSKYKQLLIIIIKKTNIF